VRDKALSFLRREPKERHWGENISGEDLSFAAVMVTADVIKHDIIVVLMFAVFTFY
jgi:hypothetical protein